MPLIMAKLAFVVCFVPKLCFSVIKIDRALPLGCLFSKVEGREEAKL